MTWMLRLAVLSLLILFFQNCGPSPSTDNNNRSFASLSEKANFSWINENIVQTKCVECHNNSLAFSGLNFTTYSGVLQAVTPGQPTSSSFYERSFTTTFFTLTEDEQEIIRLWILDGALNN